MVCRLKQILPVLPLACPMVPLVPPLLLLSPVPEPTLAASPLLPSLPVWPVEAVTAPLLPV